MVYEHLQNIMMIQGGSQKLSMGVKRCGGRSPPPPSSGFWRGPDEGTVGGGRQYLKGKNNIQSNILICTLLEKQIKVSQASFLLVLVLKIH